MSKVIQFPRLNMSTLEAIVAQVFDDYEKTHQAQPPCSQLDRIERKVDFLLLQVNELKKAL